MSFALAPEALAAGYGLASFETIGSTSTEAMQRLKAGEAGPLWVAAAEQTAGRGRRGSVWRDPAGNLSTTLAVRLDLHPSTLATLGFVAGVALVRALVRCASAETAPQNNTDERPTFQLKWPNDVLAGGAKLAGILLETEQLGAGRGVVIGIGVNVVRAPDGLPYRAASLHELGIPVSAELLFRAVSAEWTGAYAAWDEGRGFPSIRAAWLRHAAGLGGPVAVRGRAEDVAGTFETIDEAGQLVVKEADGSRRTIAAGDVHFGEAATIRPGVAA